MTGEETKYLLEKMSELTEFIRRCHMGPAVIKPKPENTSSTFDQRKVDPVIESNKYFSRIFIDILEDSKHD